MVTTTFILSWLLAGSIHLNILWTELDKKTLKNFYLWKKRKNDDIQDKHYLLALSLALLLGPLTWCLFYYINETEKGLEDNEISS